MICFPNIKINIGLNIISRRENGYHNIETVFYPVLYQDVLEIVLADKFKLINKGLEIDCAVENNLCYKAYKLIDNNFHNQMAPVQIILYKNVPFGSGLGSGSSDAASTLVLLNNLFKLNIPEQQLLNFASKIGADCAFFIKNKPVLASGIGDVFQDLDLNLKGKYLMLCLPKIAINTADAYKNCVPSIPTKSLSELINIPIQEWRVNIKNDFEESAFESHPLLAAIKQKLYDNGAVYAQMSGSGSAIYGIFLQKPDFIPEFCSYYKVFQL